MQEPELVAKALRAVLHAFKNGVHLSELQNEYRSLTNEFIPFRHLGYDTLEGYLESIPGVVRMEENKMGEVRITNENYGSEMAFVFAVCSCFVVLPPFVLWISVACIGCTNSGRGGSCDIRY